METQSLTEKVREAIAGELGLAVDDVGLDDSLRGDLAADSMDVASLVVELEDVLGIEIVDDDVQKLVTVKDVIDYAWEKLVSWPEAQDA